MVSNMDIFNDLRITGLDEASSHIEEKGNSEFHLSLSTPPLGEWVICFQNAWSHIFYNTKVRADVSGGSIVVECHHSTLNEHIQYLKEAIEEANRSCREQHAAYINQQSAENREEQKRQKILADVKRNLKL